MTLDEAIFHCEEVEEEQKKLYGLCLPEYDCDGKSHCKTLKNGKDKGCLKCAEEHHQLAEWLKELKIVRECINHIRIACFESRGDGFEDEVVEAMNEYFDGMGKDWEE